MSLRSLLGAAALLVGAVAPATFAAAPAHADGACIGGGVSVVADFGALGGGVEETCIADGGGRSAGTLFGSRLTRTQQFPGVVCRVDGKGNDNCGPMPPADAYWGLFWSSGTSASWSYASVGVDSLRIPDGGSVALAWQSTSARRAPTVAPPVTRASSPTPQPSGTRKPQPSAKPTPRATPSRPAATATRTASSGVTRGGTAGATPRSTPSASAAVSAPADAPAPPAGTTSSAAVTVPVTSPASAAPSPATTADPVVASAHAGLPAWVAPLVIVAVVGAAGGVAFARRRRA